MVLSGLVLSNCGENPAKDEDKDEESSDETTTDDPTGTVGATGTLALSSNKLAASYPEGLTITALPKAIDSTPGQAAAGTLSVATTLMLQENQPIGAPQPGPQPAGGDNFAAHPKDALKDQQEKLAGEGTCFDPHSLGQLTFENKIKDICFGFDYGIIAGAEQGLLDQGKLNPAIDGSDKSLPGVLSALKAAQGFQASTTTEACMVVKGRENVAAAAARLNATLELFQGMLCQAKADGLADETPEVGSSLDMITTFAELNKGSFGEVTGAELTRLPDESGRAVFKTEISLQFANANQSSGAYKFTLKHSPSKTGNDTYNGVLQIETDRVNDQNQANFAVLTSMIYDKSGTTAADQKLRVEVRSASFNSDKLDKSTFWETDGRVAYNPGADQAGEFGPGQTNDYAGGIGYFAFDVNPSNYAGEISFWVNPGGSYRERARGFIFKTEQADSGALSGCAWVGALTSSIRSAVRDKTGFKPSGCYTPQISNGVCGTQADNAGPQIWKQCFSQNDSGLYDLDSDKIEDDTNGYDVLPGAPTDMPDIDLSDIAVLP